VRAAQLVAISLIGAAIFSGCGETVRHSPGTGDKENGKKLFVKGCGSCHTLYDAGTTGTIGPNLDYAFVQSRIDGLGQETIQQVVRDQIAYAVENPPTAAPGMPRDIYTGQDAEDVATYVASVAGLDASGKPFDPSNPPTDNDSGGDSADGATLFASLGCAGCHTLGAAGSTGTVGPNLDDAKPSKALVIDRVTNGKGGMPAFGSQLSDEQIGAIAAYVAGNAGSGSHP
jgi:cbb3-type cytochrome c oxidase subunit III